ncbi:hypothetical protein H696_03443 [Fonticula alba]|uniref:TCTP domain-containing protein n=1 Tax=Fonticula alba TaxID=691883 RepID=A0A058Z7W8_FONAL|nr:hypothetical protein H696_03443 [Fonticula alba]KCV69978.1 hypothetical protein H696_03443 [Fonticula alba]|eukprot:XP_009495584.1 hypothetical protein H696_03443 [Fonticula alba]
MIIYTDVLGCGDELVSDVYEFELIDDVAMEVPARMITISESDDFDIGANPSAEGEDADDGAVPADAQVVNEIVHAFHLVETSFDKKSYMIYIKEYMKNIVEHLKKNDPERVTAFQKGAQSYVKKVLGQFNEYQFFTGESMEAEGMVVLCYWKGETPVMVYFKDGLRQTKV